MLVTKGKHVVYSTKNKFKLAKLIFKMVCLEHTLFLF